MRPTFIATLIPVALSLAAAGAQGADSVTVGSGASIVADMLQRKQEAELRAQFIREGRWEDVRKLDEAKAQRLQAQREQVYLRVNEELARSGNVEEPLTHVRALACDPDALQMKKSKQAVGPGTTGSY